MRVSARVFLILALAAICPSLSAQTYTESVVYAFVAGDGSAPFSISLIQASDGNFYGVTDEGGKYSDGTVFRITSAGSYSDL